MDFLCLVYKYLFKKSPHPMMKNFMEIGRWSKRFVHTSPPNILEGNGVVFENFTINHGNGEGWWPQQIIHTPPNILEGNGAVFKNYH